MTNADMLKKRMLDLSCDLRDEADLRFEEAKRMGRTDWFGREKVEARVLRNSALQLQHVAQCIESIVHGETHDELKLPKRGECRETKVKHD